MVAEKFNYAKGRMSYYLSQGIIEIRKASEIFDFGSKNKIYTYDPFSGQKRYFHKNDYYFKLVCEEYSGRLKTIEDIITKESWKK